MRCLHLLLTIAAILAVGLSAVADVNHLNDVTDKQDQDTFDLGADIGLGEDDGSFDDDDEDEEEGEDVLDPETELDGFRFKLLSQPEIYDLLAEDDQRLSVELDLAVASQMLEERQISKHQQTSGQGRRKRWVTVAGRVLMRAARVLFRGSRAGRVTTSGTRLTRQYARSGNYNTAVRDFNRFRPQNVRTINTGRLRGQTGTVGQHRFTVRTSSSSGRPTLEIRSPNRGGTFVRKVRYD